MSISKVPFRLLPKRLLTAAALLVLHLGAYVWFAVESVREGETLSPLWIFYVIACLLFYPELRRPRVSSMIVLVVFCLMVPSCMLVTNYEPGPSDLYLGIAVLVTPVYIAVGLVLSTWKFYKGELAS